MALRVTKTVAVVMLVLFGAAALHTVVPHRDANHHVQPCALCALLWTFVAIAIVYLLRRRPLEVRPFTPLRMDRPFLAFLRPYSGRAPPTPSSI